MEFVVIGIVALGIGFTLYAFLSSSSEVRNKHQIENSVYELKQQVISQNVKIQKSEFERAGLVSEVEKIRKEVETAKSELEEARANEVAMREDLQKMRLLEDNNKSNIDLLKAENESLKEKLMEKENEAKKLNDEIKSLNEKLKAAPALHKHIKKEDSKPEDDQSSNLAKNTHEDTAQNLKIEKNDEIIKDIKPDI